MRTVARSLSLDERPGASEVAPLRWVTRWFVLSLVRETNDWWTVAVAGICRHPQVSRADRQVVGGLSSFQLLQARQGITPS